MDMKCRIDMTLVQLHMSKKELARRLGVSPASLSNRLRTGRFSYDELEKMAEAMDCDFVLEFRPRQKGVSGR